MNENNNETTREEIHHLEKRNKKTKRKFNKKHKIIIIIVSSVIMLLLISFVIIILFGNKKDDASKKNKIIVDDSKMSLKEFKAIVDAYGDALSAACKNYIALNNGSIPELKDIKNDVVFDNHKVECKTSKINFDGSIYLKSCTVDGNNVLNEYAYGKELEEPKKSGDKIFLYKYKQDNIYQDSMTRETIKTDAYLVSTYDNEYGNFILVDTYECLNKECAGYHYSENLNKALIKDGEYYLYDFSNKNKTKLNINDSNISNIRFVENSSKVFGLYVTKESGKSAFYNLDSNTFVTKYEYGLMYALDSINSVFASSNNNTVLINPNSGSIEKTINGLESISEVHINGNTYYQAYPVSEGPNYSRVVLNSNLDRIISNANDEMVSTFNSDSTITMSNNSNHFYTYDINGNLIYTSKEYKSIVKILKDYVVAINNEDDLVILNRSDEVLTTLLKVTSQYHLHPLMSGWYTTNGKNGIYILVEDSNIPYGTEGSGLEYYYIPETAETGVIKTIGVGGYAKPILYLYPTKKTKVEVSFSNPEVLTTTYPKFNKSWVVTANKNGDLYDKKGKYYYGLYWEEEGSNNVDFTEGFYVDKSSAIDFLEDKLTTIGLNDKERNEFIMYWLPILEKNEHNLVYFELTKERNTYNKINIKPKPDSLLRVAIHVKKVNGPTYIKEEKLEKFKRIGFTAVEWGGVIHN